MFSKTKVRLPTVLLGSVAVVLLLAAITVGQITGVGATDSTPTATRKAADGHDDEGEDDHDETPDVAEADQALIDAGRAVYLENNCAVCHGPDAEGSDLAPALAGHSDAAVRRQVRAPTGSMPVYPPDKISSAELDALAAYISHLEAENGHPHPIGELGPMVTQHLWMTLYVLEDEETANVDDALHHIEHVLELVNEAQRAELEAVEQELLDGNLHDAGHAIEDILADTPGLATSSELVHLQLALAAVRIEDVEDAIHHLEHFLDDSPANQRGSGKRVLALLEDENLDQAERRLEVMVGEALQQDALTDHSTTNEEEESTQDDTP